MCDSPFQRLQIQIEGFRLGRHFHHCGSGTLNKDPVFSKVGHHHNKLVARAGQPVQTAAQRGSSPYGDIEMLRPAARSKAAVQGGGQGLAHSAVSLGAGIGVDRRRLRSVQNRPNALIHLLRRRHAGVAQ